MPRFQGYHLGIFGNVTEAARHSIHDRDKNLVTKLRTLKVTWISVIKSNVLIHSKWLNNNAIKY